LKIPVKYKGRKYRSIRDLCIQNGYNYPTIMVRIYRRKLTVKQAVEFTPNFHNMVRYKGKTYRTYKDLIDAHKLNVNPKTLAKRVWQCGGSISKAIKLQPGRVGRPAKTVNYKGYEYKSLRDLCMQLDIPYPSTCERLRKGRLTFNEVINTALDRRYYI